MKPSLFKKTLFVLIAFTLLLPLIPANKGQVSAAETSIPDGVYPVAYRYVKDNEKASSVANAYMDLNSGRLVVENGQVTFEHEVNKVVDSVFPFLGIRRPDSPKATTTWDTAAGGYVASGSDGYTNRTVKEAANPDRVIYSLPLYDPWAKQHDALLYINDPDGKLGAGKYVNWYNVQLELDIGSLDFTAPPEDNDDDYNNLVVTQEMFEDRLTVGYSVYQNATEGLSDGMYPPDARQELFTNLKVAENLADQNPGNSSNLKAAYILADSAIKKFESQVVVVNRSRLQAWLDTAEAWVADAKDRGETETGAPSSSTAIATGEYPVSTVTEVSEDGWSYSFTAGPALIIKGGNVVASGTRKNNDTGQWEYRNNYVLRVTGAIEKAQQLLADPLATQQQINSLFFELSSLYVIEEITKEQYFRQPVKLLLLDSFNDDAKESPYAAEIDTSAFLIQQEAHPNYEGFLNITFLAEDDLSIIGSPSPNPANGYLVTNNAGAFSFQNRYTKVTKDPAAASNTFQIPVRSNSKTILQTDDLWLGYALVRYPNDSSVPVEDRKVVYISLNAQQLDALNNLIDEAQVIHDNAAAGKGDVQYPEFAIDNLQEAIDLAKITGDKLAASRPQILSATSALQTALEEFEETRNRPVYFSAVNATKDAFSSMQSYFAQPALIQRTEDGSFKVTVTITDSATVPEFRVEHLGKLVDTTVVEQDKDANTRTISFVAEDLTGFLNAEVRNVVPSSGYDQIHKIRLNFNNVNNSSLAQLVLTASNLQRSAVEGSGAGQYPASAKTAFQLVIDAANAAAADLTATTDVENLYSQLENALAVFKSSQIAGPAPGGGNGSTSSVYPADGYYTMNFQILKDGENSPSMAQDYVVSQALVEVRGGTKTVKFVVKQSYEIKSFTIGGKSENIVESNTGNNTRITSFSLPSLTGKLNGTVYIEWYNVGGLGFDYVNKYNIQFLFDEASAASVASNTTVPGWGSSGEVGPPDDKEPPKPDQGSGPLPETPEKGDKDPEKDADTGESQTGNGNGTPSVKFSDTATHWARTSIEQAVKLGIVNGYSDGSFRPNAIVTRGEFAVMISRALGLDGEGDASKLQDFGSIPSWAQVHVARAVAAGIIGGFEDATFRAGGHLTRAQLAVIIARAAGLKLDAANASLSFTDTASIPTWARQEIAAAVKAGLVQGKDGNRFDPDATATRAEALTLIIRLLDNTASNTK